MPRYLVERTLIDGLPIGANSAGAEQCRFLVHENAEYGVTWVHSYVTAGRTASYCIYDGPSPEAIRMAAEVNSLPVDKIIEVRTLDPYFLY